MKKIIVISLLFIISNIYAQQAIKRESFSLGGSISYSSYSEDGESDSRNYLNFTPSGGYFFVDHFYTGVQLLYLYSSRGDHSFSTYGIGPELRFYFSLKQLNPFIGLSYIYSKSFDGDEDDTNMNSSLTLTAGADYFIHEHFAIEGSLNYSFVWHEYSATDFNYKSDATQFEVKFGMNYFIF
jgi:hypothetical protein